MYSTLIVARMHPGRAAAVSRIFAEFDTTEMPGLMGTRRRELFSYKGLYFHLQDFDTDGGAEHIEAVRSHPLFVDVCADLEPFVEAYEPETWRSPADAMASRFYHWSGPA